MNAARRAAVVLWMKQQRPGGALHHENRAVLKTGPRIPRARSATGPETA